MCGALHYPCMFDTWGKNDHLRLELTRSQLFKKTLEKLPIFPLTRAQWSGGRVSVLRLGGCGFNHGPGQTKDCRNCTLDLPALTTQWFLAMAPLLPTFPSGDGSNAEDKFHILRDVTITGTHVVAIQEHRNSSYNV